MGASRFSLFQTADEGEHRISGDDGIATEPASRDRAATAERSGYRGMARACTIATSAALSLLLHGSVLAAAFLWIESKPGAVTLPTEAISLELLETEVLEAVETSAAATAMASLDSVQSAPGSTTESTAASAKAVPDLKPLAPADQIEAKDASSDALRGVEMLTGALETDTPAGAERPDNARAAQEPHQISRETQSRKTPTRTAKLPEPTEPRKADSDAKKKGSASSRAAKGSSSAAGKVSASTGSALNYAALVRARVAARKPAGGGRRGTVVVAFGLSRSGGMSFASISRSSGDPMLDRSVLAAVRSAGPFPIPPPGAGLRFAIPFHFK